MGLRRKLRRAARQAKAQNAQVETPSNQGQADTSAKGGFGAVGQFVRQAKAQAQGNPAPAQPQGNKFGQQVAQVAQQANAQRAAAPVQPSGNPAPAPAAAGTMQNQVAMAVEAQKGQADAGAGISRRDNVAAQGRFQSGRGDLR